MKAVSEYEPKECGFQMLCIERSITKDQVMDWEPITGGEKALYRYSTKKKNKRNKTKQN